MSTLGGGGIMSTSGGYHQYIEGCSVHRGYHDACGGYREYIGAFNINQRLLSTCFPT